MEVSSPDAPEHHQGLRDLLHGREYDQARELACALGLPFATWHALAVSAVDQEERPLDFLRVFGTDARLLDREARRVALACAERLLPAFPEQAALLEETLAVVRGFLAGRVSLEGLKEQERRIDLLAGEVLDERPHEFVAYAAAEAANTGSSGLRGACQEVLQHGDWAERGDEARAWLSEQLRIAAHRLWAAPQ